MISLDKDLNSKPKFHYKFSIINFVAHSIFVNVLLVFLCICLFVCVLAYWLLIFMSVYSLIFIWLHTHGETRKYAQFVCECLGVPRPSRASPRTAPGLKQCTAPACWPARTAEQREPEAERHRPTVSRPQRCSRRARAPAWDRASRSRSNLSDLLWGSLWGTWVSGLVAGVSCGFHFLAIERIFSPSAARCCTTSETFLLFPTKFPQHGTQAKSR